MLSDNDGPINPEDAFRGSILRLCDGGCKHRCGARIEGRKSDRDCAAQAEIGQRRERDA